MRFDELHLGQSAMIRKTIGGADILMFAGLTGEARAEVLELFPEKRRVRLRTVCGNQSGDTVLAGEALMLVDDIPTFS